MTQEKGWLGPYAPADPHQKVKTIDIVDEVKAIFDDKNNIIKQLRGEIESVRIANRDLLDWYNSSREDAAQLREKLKNAHLDAIEAVDEIKNCPLTEAGKFKKIEGSSLTAKDFMVAIAEDIKLEIQARAAIRLGYAMLKEGK